jgi:putative membrane protein
MRYAAALMAAILAAPLSAMAQTAATSMPMTPSSPGAISPMVTPTTAAEYVAAAGAADFYEKTSSQLVLDQNGSDPGVRQFAQHMIADHAESTDKIAAAAQAAGVQPKPPAMTKQQQAMIEQLRATTTAKGRDHIYVTQQISAHRDALALHQTYAERGDMPALRQVAQDVAQTVQEHIRMLQGLTQG